MEPVHVAHLIVLGMWLGVVITEAQSRNNKLCRRRDLNPHGE